MKVVSAILAVGLMVVGSATIHLRREVRVSREQIALLEARLQEQHARNAGALVAQATYSPAASETSVPLVTAPAAEPSPAAAAVQPAPAVTSPDMSVLRAQLSSPETRVRVQALMRTMLEASYPDLREVLDLSADEAQKLLELVAANQSDFNDLYRSPDLASTSPQERTRVMAERQEANEAAVRAMLGSKYPQWQEYAEARPAYQQRQDLRAVLNAAGTPLTEAQEKSLIAALAAEQREFSQQVRDAASQSKPFNPIALSNPERRQRQLDAAAPHLSPEQLESYRGMLDRAAQQRAIFAPSQVNQPGAAATR